MITPGASPAPVPPPGGPPGYSTVMATRPCSSHSRRLPRVAGAGAHLLVLLAAIRPAAAQAVRTVTLSGGGTEFADVFSEIGGAVELRDGRLIVLDTKEKELRLVDFARGTMTPISRLGGGPLEYQVPGLLLGGVDTVVYYDAMQRRYLLLGPTGAPIRTAPFGSTDLATLIAQAQPAATDAHGVVFGVTTGMKMPAAGSGAAPTDFSFADTVEVQRLDRTTGKAVTITKIRSAAASTKPKIETANGGVRLTLVAPDFSPIDAWTTLPDGRVAVLRDGIYRVHFLAPGKPETVGPAIPFASVPVTAIERKAMIDSLQSGMDRSLQQARSMPGAANAKFEARVLEPPHWQPTKPAYASLRAGPDGRLWVGIPRPSTEKAAQFDVLDGRTGARLFRVQLAPGESLVALGRGAVYTMRKDEDDLQYLRRYVLP